MKAVQIKIQIFQFVPIFLKIAIKYKSTIAAVKITVPGTNIFLAILFEQLRRREDKI